MSKSNPQESFFQEKLTSSSKNKDEALSVHVGSNLKTLHSMLDLILIFGNGLLRELLALHKNVSFWSYQIQVFLFLVSS